MDFFLILSYITTLYGLVNATLYLKSLIRDNRALRFFTLYLIIIGIIQLASIVIGKVFHQPNLFLSHFYFISQFVLLTLFYNELLQFKRIKVVLWGVLLFIGYQFISDPEIFFRYNPLGMAITNAIIVVYAILYFYKSLTASRGFIIVNIGVFFYLLSSTLIFASGNLVLDLGLSEKMNFYLINVNRVLYLLLQILITLEWYRNYRRKQ